MYTTPTLNKTTELPLYHDWLQSDHDFRVWCDVLTLEETLVSQVDLLDGQVNYNAGEEGPERTSSLVLSDPEGALSFGTSYASDDSGVLWVNRLLRVRHEVDVPGLGTVGTIPFIGCPTAVGRKGGEISIEAGDKSLLADHGVRPRTYKKGTRVDLALRSIMKDLTGEWHLRIPTTKKKLSRSYTVGMGEDALTPWDCFKRIAGTEMGWRPYYSADGYATCEPTAAAKTTVPVHDLLALPDANTSFTEFINYVKVTSRRKGQNKGKDGKPKGKPYTIVYEGVATLPTTHDLSEQSLARHGVPRTLPLVVDDDALKTGAAVNAKAKSTLIGGSSLASEQSYETMPFFHLDKGDRLNLPENIGDVAFDDCSIPLGTGGNMTIGKVKWVSAPVKVVRLKSKRTVIRKKSKGGKDNKGKGGK